MPARSKWCMADTLDIDVKAISQVFTSCVHDYERACKEHANGITRTRKFLHGIDSSV